MIFKVILQEPSFINGPRSPFAEGCYLVNESFYNIGVLNAKVGNHQNSGWVQRYR